MEKFVLDKEIKDKWVAALRSGEYKQGRGSLRTVHDEFCCLGVLADCALSGEWTLTNDTNDFGNEIYGYNYGSISSVIKLPNCLIPEKTQIKLMNMNDGKYMSFDEIADWIEENL